MTKRDFFRVLIKIFGLYSLVANLFAFLPSNLGYILSNEIDLFPIIVLLLIIGVLVFLFIYLIFKTDAIIDLLKLDKGFDEDRIYFEKFNSENIMKLSIMILGGFLLLDNIPSFLVYTWGALRSESGGTVFSSREKYYWGISFINIIAGYLLLNNMEYIIKKLEVRKEEN